MILYYFQTLSFIRTHVDLITMFPFSWINEFQTSERDTISENTGCLLSQANKTIHEKILYFLNLTGSLSKVEEAFIKYDNNLKNYPEQKSLFPSLRVPLEIDLKEIQEISGDYILKLLINEPQMTSSIVQRVIYTYIVSKLSLEDFQQQQLEIPLKIKSLSNLTVCSISNIHVGKLTLLRGTLLSISTPTKFIRSYGLKCSLTSCNSKRQRVIGAPPQRISLCSLCGNSLQEVPEACEMGEQTSGFLVVLPEYQNLHNTAFNKQAILLCFKDETMRGLEPGLEYEIAGQMTLKSFQVWAVQRKCHINQEIDFHSIPSSIRKLQQDIEILCPDSPWTFVGSLASALSANDYSETCFFNLKMGLLLSLASQGEAGGGGGARPVAVAAVGPETRAAHRLMRRAAALRRRGAPLEWGAAPGGQLRWDAAQGLGWVEAGPLLLAAGGVCCLGDWAKLRPKAAQAVLSAVETGYVHVDSQNVKNLTPPSFPLRCSVWTYLLWSKKNKNGINSIKPLTQTFGVPFLAGDDNNSEQIIHSTLLRYMRHSSPSPIVSDDDFKEYLNLVTLKEVSISTAASQLIQKYFVASRRAQPERLPVNAVGIITLLSEAYARLTLKDEVTPEHVIAVLQLYEESLCYLHGVSVINAPPPVVLSSGIFTPQWIHYSLQEFSKWLEDFIHSFVGNNSQYF